MRYFMQWPSDGNVTVIAIYSTSDQQDHFNTPKRSSKNRNETGRAIFGQFIFALLVLLMYTSINFPGACICGISFYTLGTLWQKEQ